MSSVMTLRLNRRKAFANDSPSCSRISATLITPKPALYRTHSSLLPLCGASWPPTAKFAVCFAKPLNILQLVLIQSEIVTQFMDDSQADLFADFSFVGADRLNILLVKHDVIGS